MAIRLADNALEERECVGGQTYRGFGFEPAPIEANAAKVVPSFEDEQSGNWLLLAETEVEREQEEWGGANYYCIVSPMGTTLIIRNNVVVGGGLRLAIDANIGGGVSVMGIPAVGSGFAVNVEPELSNAFMGGYQIPSLHLTGYMTGLPLPWIQRLRELQQLPAGWDSYDARSVSLEVIEKTKSVLLDAISPGGLGPPALFIAPTSNGGIGLEWKLESGKEFVLEIPPEGNMSYLLVVPKAEGGEEETEGIVQSPQELQRLLRTLK